MRLSDLAVFKLQTLADKFGLKRSTFATEILLEAIEDTWQTIDFPPFSESEDLQRRYESFARAIKRASKKPKTLVKKRALEEPSDLEEILLPMEEQSNV